MRNLVLLALVCAIARSSVVANEIRRTPLEILGAKIKAETEAKKLAFDAYAHKMNAHVLANEGVYVTVIKIGYEIEHFAKKGDQLWEARIMTLENELRGVIWVHPNTGEVRLLVGVWGTRPEADEIDRMRSVQRDVAMALMSLLNVDEGITEKNTSNHESHFKDVKKLGNFVFIKHKTKQLNGQLQTDFDLTDDEGAVKIHGSIIEAASPRSTRIALFEHLVNCSAPLEVLIKIFEIKNLGFGDFCITKKRYDTDAKQLVSDNNLEIHFVRGSTAISLRSNDPKHNLVNVAKAMDEMCGDVRPKSSSEGNEGGDAGK